MNYLWAENVSLVMLPEISKKDGPLWAVFLLGRIFRLIVLFAAALL